MRTKSVGIEMPDDFPTERFNRVQGIVLEPVRPQSEQAWSEASRGWNNVALRFRAAADDSGAFIASVNQHGAAPSHEERYQQERHLYGVFVGGQSSLESFGYSVWAVCSAIVPGRFPISTLEDLRDISLRKLRRDVSDEFVGENFARVLNRQVLRDRNWRSWNQTRNMLAHPGFNHPKPQRACI